MAIRINFPFVKGNQLQRCPECDEILSADSINVKEGVALCPGCGCLTRLSGLNYSDRSIDEIVDRPPNGCSIDDANQRLVIVASIRSVFGLLASAGFGLFWNATVSIFVLIAVAGLYTNLIGPLPVWFPAPGLKDGKPEMNGHAMELGETLFFCLFLTPFVAVGIGSIGMFFMYLIGTVEVVIDELDSYVATRIGYFKWRTRFDPKLVRDVKIIKVDQGSEGQTCKVIELSGDQSTQFGSLLKADRMKWMWAVTKTVFRQKSDNKRKGSSIPELSGLKSSR